MNQQLQIEKQTTQQHKAPNTKTTTQTQQQTKHKKQGKTQRGTTTTQQQTQHTTNKQPMNNNVCVR